MKKGEGKHEEKVGGKTWYSRTGKHGGGDKMKFKEFRKKNVGLIADPAVVDRICNL